MTETELQEIKCITLTGENVVISAAHFDALLSTVRELQRQVQERDRLLEDAHQELLGNECGSPELHHAIQDVLIESEQAALNKEQPNE